MAYVMTYNSLVESVVRWVIRDSDSALLAEIPAMIDTTERKVARALKTLMSVRYVTSTMEPSNPLIVKPDRWLETVSLEIGIGTDSNTSVQLLSRTYEYIKQVYPDVSAIDVPKYFSDFEFNQLFIGPTPNASFPFQLAYYERPEPLGENNQQNWLTQYAPDLMRYGVLAETGPFLINDERIQMWQNIYDRKLVELVGEDARRLIIRTEKTKEA